MNKTIKFIAVLFILYLLTGCWDKLEIEERAYVSVIGIDLNTDEQSPQGEYRITYSFPNLNAIGKNASSEKGKFVLSGTGKSIYDTNVAISMRINKTLFLKHVKAIVIGEDLAKNPDKMKAIFDGIGRSNVISRKAVVLIAKGTAQDVINIKDEMEPVTGALIEELLDNYKVTARFNHQNIGQILISLNNVNRALLPRVIPKENEIIIAGSSVIKNFKHIAWLGELETRATMFLKGMVKGEVIDVVIDDVEIPYVVSGTKVIRSADVEDGIINMNYNVELEGYTQMFKMDTEEKIMDNRTIKKIEEQIEKVLEEEIIMTIEKIQKEFNADVIEVEDYLRKFKPDLWESVKDDWDEVFPKINITVNVDAKLRRVGMTK